MRDIDVSALESVGRAGSGPWLLAGDTILKTYAHGEPLQTFEQAQAVFEAYRVAYDAGAATPRPEEIVSTGDGFGVVVEYVMGIALPAHIAFGSYSPQEAGEALGLLLRRLHGSRCTEGRDVHADFRRYARVLATRLPSRIADRLVSLVDGIPSSSTFLHGDVHVSNVVVSQSEPRLIDLELCGFGHPVFDLAITRTRLLLNDNAFSRYADSAGCSVARLMWDSCLSAYFPGASSAFLEEMDRMTAILAELEHCCFKFRIGAAPEGLTNEQSERVELCARRLDGLLDCVERLYFEAGGTAIPGIGVPHGRDLCGIAESFMICGTPIPGMAVPPVRS